MRASILLTFLTALFSLNTFAQSTEHTNNHEHHNNEIGIANGPVYFLKENVLSYGLHVHYVRKISHSKFGIGFGYERIFDEHQHSTFGFLVSYSPIDKLSLNVSPGITFEGGESEMNFAIHLETSYEFELNDFHLGPVLEFASDPEDIHLSLGLHIGYGF